jgi:hypothetical protein
MEKLWATLKRENISPLNGIIYDFISSIVQKLKIMGMTFLYNFAQPIKMLTMQLLMNLASEESLDHCFMKYSIEISLKMMKSLSIEGEG